jgi:Asp-tRNA(Asn)/Glu-tRNA(Gln) amidotransferase C subunit
LPYYVVSVGKKVVLWNVDETAEKVLRSRASVDYWEDHTLKQDVKKELGDIKDSVKDLKEGPNAAAKQTYVIENVGNLRRDLDATTTDLQNTKRDLEAAAKKADVEKVVKGLLTGLAAAATLAHVEKELGDLHKNKQDIFELSELLSKITDLVDRVTRLETKPVDPPKPEPPPVVPPEKAPIDTGEQEKKPADETDPFKKPPKYMTYSKTEAFEELAGSFGIDKAKLLSYNEKFNTTYNKPARNSRSTSSFWTAKKWTPGDVAETVLVVIPELVNGKIPIRKFNAIGHPIKDNNIGLDISIYFGYSNIPTNMEAKARNGLWYQLKSTVNYNDNWDGGFDLNIPAATYDPNASSLN